MYSNKSFKIHWTIFGDLLIDSFTPNKYKKYLFDSKMTSIHVANRPDKFHRMKYVSKSVSLLIAIELYSL